MPMTPVAPARKILILVYSAKHMRWTFPFGDDSNFVEQSKRPASLAQLIHARHHGAARYVYWNLRRTADAEIPKLEA
jgi:hypothetical protein